MCPHTYTPAQLAASDALHAIYVSSYYYMCPHTYTPAQLAASDALHVCKEHVASAKNEGAKEPEVFNARPAEGGQKSGRGKLLRNSDNLKPTTYMVKRGYLPSEITGKAKRFERLSAMDSCAGGGGGGQGGGARGWGRGGARGGVVTLDMSPCDSVAGEMCNEYERQMTCTGAFTTVLLLLYYCFTTALLLLIACLARCALTCRSAGSKAYHQLVKPVSSY
jgi:hypothetical protein